MTSRARRAKRSESPSDRLARAQLAFDAGELDTALEVLLAEVTATPTNVAAHLLMGRCFLEAERFPQALQVFSSLVVHPEIRGHAELPRDETDELLVQTLLEWGFHIEQTGFGADELERFGRAVAFYAGPTFQGRHADHIVRLDRSLRQHEASAEQVAELIDS